MCQRLKICPKTKIRSIWQPQLGVTLIETSAFTGSNIESIFKILASQIKLEKDEISVNLSGYKGPFLTSPLGANFDPRGEVVPKGRICPLRVKLSPGGEILCSHLHSSKQ
jgi:hypothetical protein